MIDKHFFSTKLAKRFGIEAAIMIENLFYWIDKNAANNVHYYDGSYWTYNSVQAFSKLFDYMNITKINRVLDFLEGKEKEPKDGKSDKKLIKIIKSGNYNKSKMDRTKWYAFTDEGLEILKECGYELSKNNHAKRTNAFSQNEQMHLVKMNKCNSAKRVNDIISNINITSNNTNINTDISTDEKELTDVSSTDDTEPQHQDNEKENTASAIPEKKAKKLESSDIAAAADPASRYGKFLLWMRQDTPYCYKNLTLPTEKQFEKLLNDYGGESVKDIVEEIENRKDKRKNYSNLNLTIKNWMKYRESKKQ